MVQRVLTAAVLILVILGTLFAPSPWVFAGVMLLAMALCAYEATELVATSKQSALPAAAFWAAGFGALLFVATKEPLTAAWVAGLMGLTVLGVWSCWKRISWLAGAYPAGALAALTLIHFMPQTGPPLVLAAMVPIWAGDTFAMLAGRQFGKTPLAPSLSPKKTREGAMGNVVASLIASLAMGPACGLPWGVSVGIGLSAGVVGQAGDLFESFLKRRAEKKDSGTLLPGHGGIFDRIDALLPHAALTLCVLYFR